MEQWPWVLITLAVSSVFLAGCHPTSTASTTPAHSEQSQPSAETAEQEARVLELEAQLALAQAEAEDLRTELQQTEAERAERRERTAAITIGPTATGAATDAESVASDGEAEPFYGLTEDDVSGPRPLLRVHGVPAPVVPGGVAPILTAAPLPVTATVGPPVTPGAGALPPPRRRPDSIPGTDVYRRALRAVVEQRLGDARSALDQFLAESPTHPYRDNALYWRGEMNFLEHRYQEAIADLEQLLSSFPTTNRAADALYRLSLCFDRVGQRDRAQQVRERLSQLHAGSAAARLARVETGSVTR